MRKCLAVTSANCRSVKTLDCGMQYILVEGVEQVSKTRDAGVFREEFFVATEIIHRTFRLS